MELLHLHMENFPYNIYYKSPCGLIEISSSENGITALFFIKSKSRKENKNEILSECVSQLEEYFHKKRKSFSLPLDLHGTKFQKRVWEELLHIPYGKTISYLHLAEILGDKNSMRAVGGANGKNPVSIIIPCHRVIGANGNLIGYGGGLDIKKWLLEFEGALIQQELFVSRC